MKKHLIITMIACFLFGYGMAVKDLGIKAGLGFWASISIFAVGQIFFIIVAFTSLQKIRKIVEQYKPSTK